MIAFLDIGLAFIEGVVLVASPCILPILPLVLGISLKGGKYRPYRVVAGFIITFAIMASFAGAINEVLGISTEILQTISYVILLSLGLILCLPFLDEYLSRFTNKISNFASKAQSKIENTNNGEEKKSSPWRDSLNDVLFGVLIGLVWLPCSGPIVASVLVQVLRFGATINSFFIVLAFAIGFSIPMLVIALSGRTLLNKIRAVFPYTTIIRRTLGVLIVAVSALGLAGYNLGYLISPESIGYNDQRFTSAQLKSNELLDNLATTYVMPSIVVDGAKWFNSPALSMEDLKGKVVLVDFWTYSCINCVRTIPYLKQLHDKYAKDGLVILGVHAPEFAFEKDPNNVQKAINKYELKYPIVQDNDFIVWDRYQNRYWPAKYLVNKEGVVVYSHFGEGNYEVTEHNIRVLLGISEEELSGQENISVAEAYTYDVTHETYLGSNRSSTNNSVMANDTFSFPENLAKNTYALSGSWNIEPENITSTKAGAKLRLNFNAKKVFLVLNSEKPANIKLSLNGKPLTSQNAGGDVTDGSIIKIHGDDLYELVSLPDVAEGLLEIEADEGVKMFAFTFG